MASAGLFFARDADSREQKSSTQLLYPLYIDRAAWEQGQARKNTLFPQNRWIGDFVEWQQEEVYQKAFGHLLKALQQGVADGQ